MSSAAQQPASPLADFAVGYGFPLDAFQVEACQAIERGEGVLVAAPTGSGKTVVGEFAVHLALAGGHKCFYTTPIKALSNQKYNDLVARYGDARVGLLTGDNAINGDAPVVVMTTEVLRNMLYSGSDALRGLRFVVMDEVHYLADRFRGAVWEEVIIHLADSVTVVSLSATVSNAEEFADWLRTVRGDTHVVIEEHRPVPLWQHVLVGNRLYDLFLGEELVEDPTSSAAHGRLRVNPQLLRVARDDGWPPRGGPRGRPRSRVHLPSRVEVIETLDAAGLLPAITFIFSRAGCDAAVTQCLRAGLRLNTPAERDQVRAHVEARTAAIPDEDLAVLGYYDWLDGLERGVAAHHAGMLPTFKEVVEELFVRGLVKAVFATETLALGINMPARTVILEKLTKWNGEAHVDVTPGEYTQLTGRAGRRGIDVEGHAVVLWQPGFDPHAVAGLASTRTYPLRSSFRPSYNMAVNLVRTLGRQRARQLLESSFAQFQADRSVVGLARQVRRNEEALAGYRDAVSCDLGDFDEYMGLRQDIRAREATLSREHAAARKSAAAESLERLRIGDVIRMPSCRRSSVAVVLDPGVKNMGSDGPHPMVLTMDRQVKRLSVADFAGPVDVLGSMRVPRSFNPRSPQSRRDLASSLRNTGLDTTAEIRGARARAAAADDDQLAQLRRQLRDHPCHHCPDREEHARWAERYDRLDRDTKALRRRMAGRTNTVPRTFDRVCGVLEDLGYLHGDEVTAAGAMLAEIYSESDLLVVEALRTAAWGPLRPAELAAVVSALVYEARQTEEAAPRLPRGAPEAAVLELQRRWLDLHDLEDRHGLHFLAEPDAGFAWPTWRWASGHRLDAVLTDADLAAGDFVRWTKQLIDLLGQIADAAGESPVRATARAALDAVRRGVVAYSSVG